MRSLSSLSNLTSHDFHSILDYSFYFKQKYNDNGYLRKGEQVLSHKNLISIFYENSTRTLLSFKNAVEILGGNLHQFDIGTSSLSKGESFVDTVTTLRSLMYQGLIVRTSDQGIINQLNECQLLPHINAGSSSNAHPSQALLDLMTLKEAQAGKNICIIGDLKHSRVAKSLFRLLPQFGFKIHIYAPKEWIDEDCREFTILTSKQELKHMDVLYCLRIQKERQEKFNIDSTWYFNQFGIEAKDVKNHQMVMHPGPINRMLDLHSNVLDLPKCLINRQVENGIFTRMGILKWVYNE